MSHKFAMVFPGQGSQSLGMLSEFAQNAPLFKTIFTRASTVLNYDLWQLIQEGPEEKLNQTEYTQPALLAAEVALWECWKNKTHLLPAYMVGHSLGEYSALVCAEALRFEDAVQLVAHRGRYMQAAVPSGKGGMAAVIGLDEKQILEICDEVAQGEILSPANYNSIGQIVIAGDLQAVERAVNLAKQKGAKLAKIIPVSVPSHCALMQPAADRLAKELSGMTIQSPKIPVIQNYDVQAHRDPDVIRKGLIQQLTNPVRWVESIQYLLNEQIFNLVECGPGKVLAGLNKRIHSDAITYAINDPELLTETIHKIGGAEVCL